jgi:hypothetical protein
MNGNKPPILCGKNGSLSRPELVNLPERLLSSLEAAMRVWQTNCKLLSESRNFENCRPT